MNGPPPTLVEELSRLAYTLMRLLLAQAKGTFAQEGISLLQAEVLRLVKEGIRLPSRLAEHMGILPSQVSHLLASLEEAGLLYREPHQEDRRQVFLHLTPQGEAVRKRIQEAWLLAFGQQLSRLSPAELQQFRNILRKLTGVEGV